MTTYKIKSLIEVQIWEGIMGFDDNITRLGFSSCIGKPIFLRYLTYTEVF